MTKQHSMRTDLLSDSSSEEGRKFASHKLLNRFARKAGAPGGHPGGLGGVSASAPVGARSAPLGGHLGAGGAHDSDYPSEIRSVLSQHPPAGPTTRARPASVTRLRSSDEFEGLQRENFELRQKVRRLERELQDYRSLEENLAVAEREARSTKQKLRELEVENQVLRVFGQERFERVERSEGMQGAQVPEEVQGVQGVHAHGYERQVPHAVPQSAPHVHRVPDSHPQTSRGEPRAQAQYAHTPTAPFAGGPFGGAPFYTPHFPTHTPAAPQFCSHGAPQASQAPQGVPPAAHQLAPTPPATASPDPQAALNQAILNKLEELSQQIKAPEVKGSESDEEEVPIDHVSPALDRLTAAVESLLRVKEEKEKEKEEPKEEPKEVTQPVAQTEAPPVTPQPQAQPAPLAAPSQPINVVLTLEENFAELLHHIALSLSSAAADAAARQHHADSSSASAPSLSEASTVSEEEDYFHNQQENLQVVKECLANLRDRDPEQHKALLAKVTEDARRESPLFGEFVQRSLAA